MTVVELGHNGVEGFVAFSEHTRRSSSLTPLGKERVKLSLDCRAFFAEGLVLESVAGRHSLEFSGERPRICGWSALLDGVMFLDQSTGGLLN